MPAAKRTQHFNATQTLPKCLFPITRCLFLINVDLGEEISPLKP